LPFSTRCPKVAACAINVCLFVFLLFDFLKKNIS
jgi:hypothetical protein